MSATRSLDDPLPYPTSESRLRIISLLLGECPYFAVQTLKDFIRVLIGRKPRLDERRLFHWQIVRHLAGIRRLDKITCVPLSCEGPGSQVISVMNAINFARCAGLAYVHTPFSEIQHPDRSMQDWAAAWETLFNLGAGEFACDHGKLEMLNHCHHGVPPELWLGWDHRYDEIHQNFNAMIPEFRRKYYLNKSPRQNEKITVAVHVRSGWDMGSPSASYRSRAAKSILRTITLVKSVLDSHAIQHTINIYSEGGRADFAELCTPEIQMSKYRVGRHARGRTDDVSDLSLSTGEFVRDIDALSAMQEMVEADVLLIGASTFSYCAAVISDGIKIFGCVPERPWIDGSLLRSDDGSFDIAAFDRQLSLLMQANAALK
jgi:hypothetical protein